MEPTKRVSVEDRERAIFKYLQEPEVAERGATVRELWEAVSERLGDGVTVQAYHKLVDRLVAVDKLDVAADSAADGGRRFIVAPHLHADTAVTLDDVYELLEELAPSEAIARVLDARDYFEERRGDSLKRAADALLDEDPVDLVEAMLLQKLEELRTDVELLRDRELADRELSARVGAEFRELHLLAYRYLGLSTAAFDVARPEEVVVGRREVSCDPQRLREELNLRVFGARVITPVDISASHDEMQRMAVAGSDASTHASVMELTTARTFSDEVGNQVVTFNNSVVYVDLAPVTRGAIEFPYYSVPMTRSALDDRSNRGMVLAPFMFRYLSESEYEHMAKCATDVVQWRADEIVFLGTARSLRDGTLLPRPTVHFRDGTITPQEREFGHYKRANEYGDMVREGIAHGRKVLEKILVSEKPPVFAGAVKATQARFFSVLLNWYIAKGSRRRLGKPLDPNWDMTRAAHIADNEAMSFLLSTLEDKRKKGVYYVTCAVMRPFHTLTEYYRAPDKPDYDWVDHFRKTLELERRSYEQGLASELPYLATVPDIADDDFVFMCRKADYVAFYVGHTAGEPPPVAPRYEFLEGLRRLGVEEARARVARNVRLVVSALHRTGFSADKEHNFLSKKFLVKIVPHVVFDAHEKCKALGRKLEAELRSIVIQNLQVLKRIRTVRGSEIKFVPLSIRRFVERYARAIEEERKRDPDKFTR